MTARCSCPVCLARSIARARCRPRRGQIELADRILEMLLLDLPPQWGHCLAEGGDPLGRIAPLEQQLFQYRGWTRAYQAQERARVEMGARCPCLAGARR